MAKIVDLIAKCDESEISTQNLDENIVSGRLKGGNGYFTFLTDPKFVKERALDKPSTVGIVIWFPKDIFERLEK